MQLKTFRSLQGWALRNRWTLLTLFSRATASRKSVLALSPGWEVEDLNRGISIG